MLRVLIKGDSRFPVSRKVVKNAVAEVINQHHLASTDIELSIRIGGDRLLKSLNRRYRQLDEPAEILSFSQQEIGPIQLLSRSQSLDKVDQTVGFITSPNSVLYLGDVVVSYPQAREDAARENTLVGSKIAELIQHGVKHLLGDHHS